MSLISSKEDLNNQMQTNNKMLRLIDSRYNIESKIKIIISYLFMFIGLCSLIAAIPRSQSSVVSLFFFNVNLGTQLDLIRLIVGIVLIYIGLKGIKLQW